jgi:hypothetical protein
MPLVDSEYLSSNTHSVILLYYNISWIPGPDFFRSSLQLYPSRTADYRFKWLRCVAAHHFIPSVFKSHTSSVFFYPHETSTIISLEGGSWSTQAKRKDDMEEKDDKGKGKKEEQEAEDTTAQKKKVQDGAEERRHEDSSADNYDLEESKGIAVF